MRLRDLREADRPVGTKDPTELDWDTMFDEPTSKGELSTTRKTTGVKPGSEPKATPKMKIGSKSDTARATAAMTPTDAMRDMMSRINVPGAEDQPPEQALVPHEPVTPANVPAVISREIEMTDPSMVRPTWHAVANLPGNMRNAILTLGKALFGAFTKTPTRDIVMIGNVSGQGPNGEKEVRSVAKWIVDHGSEVDTAAIDFGQTIPGYQADVKQYSTAGVRFMLVKDPFGSYIYAWPEGDSHDAAPRIGSPKDRRPHRSIGRR